MPARKLSTRKTKKATVGETPRRARPPSTMPSSATLAAVLVTGSGEVLMSKRAPALAECVTRLTPPKSRAATTETTGSSSPRAARASRMPPAGRITVCIESQAESSHGTLSAKNSTTKNAPATPMIHQLPRISSSA